MLNQAIFDEVADLLVEQGIRVTYDSVNDALKDRDRANGGPGQGKSDRDLQAPLADWKRRRRYRPYLAHLELTDQMDKALASFVDRALDAARHAPKPSVDLPQRPSDPPLEAFADLTRRLDEISASMASLADTYGSLRKQVHVPNAAEPVPPQQTPPRTLRKEERRRGLAAAAGRFFWDRMMQSFVEAIREQGPMTAAELIETLDEDALAIAEAAFEKVTVSLVAEKIAFRISKNNYFRMTDDGRYDLLPKNAGRNRKKGER
jgi:hypothetical protein